MIKPQTRKLKKTPNSKRKKKRTKPNPSPTLICTTCLHLFLNFLSQITTLYRRPSLVVVEWLVFAILLNPYWLCCWWLEKIMVVIVDHLKKVIFDHMVIFDHKYHNHVHYLSYQTKGPAPSKSCMSTYLTSRLIT